MGHLQHQKVDSDYKDLLFRLEKANESLSFYKNNKEICLRDLHKLELENSALAEENEHLKRKIRNVEKNSVYQESQFLQKLENSHDFQASNHSCYSVSQSSNKGYKKSVTNVPRIREFEKATSANSNSNKRTSMSVKASRSLIPHSRNRQFSLKENALLQLVLLIKI